jgi:multicomponent Na+:H+ antiporter subunit D
MNILVLPIVVPFFCAALCLFFRKSIPAQRFICGVASLALPVLAGYLYWQVKTQGILVLRLGNWPGPFGIVFTVDYLSCIMLMLAGITQAFTWWFLVAGGASKLGEKYLIYPLFLMLGTGVNWAFITGDLFNLFVSFEILLLSSYVLLVHGSERTQIRESFKFVVLNIIASTLFLVSAGFAYGMFGSLNMAELAVRISTATEYRPQAVILGTMLLVTFGSKAALFPVFFWLPDSYPKAPHGIVAYFSGILTKVGVYCLYRMFTLIFRDVEFFTSWFQPLLLGIAAFTMLVGVLCALSQWTIRRILSFHIISQIGYMIFALGLFTPLALASGIFYIIHHIIVKASLFLVADSVELNDGSQELKKCGGVLKVYPVLTLSFLLASLSLAGIPPLSGFYGKYGLVVEGLNEGYYFYVGISLLTSLFTLMSMMKIFRYVFWGERGEGKPVKAKLPGVIAATTGLVMVAICVMVFSAWLMSIALETSAQLLDRDQYIGAVLGNEGVALLHSVVEVHK